MHEDIDWLNASSDFGLIQLCREMAALAHPVEKLASLASKRRRSNPYRRTARSVAATTGPLARRALGA